EPLTEEGYVHGTPGPGCPAQLACREHLPHAGEQVVIRVWLGDVVVRTALQTAHDIHRVGQSGEQHYRKVCSARHVLDRPAHVVSADARHDDVRQHQVERTAGHLREGFLTAVHHYGFQSVLGEQCSKCGGLCGAVLHNEHSLAITRRTSFRCPA